MSGSPIQMDIAQAVSSFRWNQAEFERFIAGPNGAVAKDLVKRAVRVEAAAKENATGRPGPEVRTGRLRGSITWRLGVDAGGIYADIGSNVLYAPYLESGTSRMQPYPFLVPALESARVP